MLTRLAGLVLPPFTFSWSVLALALSVGVGIAVLGSLVPLLASVRRPAAMLLRGEATTGVAAPRVLTRSTRWLGRWSPIVAMSFRDPFRRPLRTTLIVAASAVALSAVLASQVVDHSLRVTIADLYTRYRADAWMLTNPGVPPTYARRLEQLPPVRAAEPWTMMQGAIGSVRTDVWGVPAETVVYDPRLVAGSWLEPTWPPAVVLTANLAARVQAGVGDVVSLDLGSRRIPVRVIGVVDDESTYLGATTIGKVFVERSVLEKLLGREDRPSLYALQFWVHMPADAARVLTAVEQHERSLRPLTLLMADDRAATERVLAILTVLARAVVLVVVSVAVFGIGNALLLDISERRRELGILRSVGAESVTLAVLLAGQALVIVALAALLAFPVGIVSGTAILEVISAHLFHVPLAWGHRLEMLVLGAAVVSAGAAMLVPLVVATRIRPVEVLRYGERRRWWFALGLVVLLVASALVAVWWSRRPSETVWVVRRGDLTSSLELPGRVVALRSVAARAAYDTRVRVVAVQPGDTVEAGDIVAVLDDSPLLSRHEQAQQQLLQAEAALAQAEASGAPVETRVRAEEQRRRALDAYREATERLADKYVLAPSDGIVTEVTVTEGLLSVPVRSWRASHWRSRWGLGDGRRGRCTVSGGRKAGAHHGRCVTRLGRERDGRLVRAECEPASRGGGVPSAGSPRRWERSPAPGYDGNHAYRCCAASVGLARTRTGDPGGR